MILTCIFKVLYLLQYTVIFNILLYLAILLLKFSLSWRKLLDFYLFVVVWVVSFSFFLHHSNQHLVLRDAPKRNTLRNHVVYVYFSIWWFLSVKHLFIMTQNHIGKWGPLKEKGKVCHSHFVHLFVFYLAPLLKVCFKSHYSCMWCNLFTC